MPHAYHHVTMASFSPDGRQVLSASSDKTAKVWDAYTGLLIAASQHDGRVLAARYNRPGDRFVTASDDGTVRIWNSTNGVPITPPLQHTGAISWIEFSPDGEQILTGCADHTARLWDSVTASQNGSVQFWNIQARRMRGLEMPHAKPVTLVAFDPRGKPSSAHPWIGPLNCGTRTTARSWANRCSMRPR